MKVDNCLKCGKKIYDAYWHYAWKGKSGHMCEKCGTEFHEIGYELLEKAAKELEEMGITVSQTKEKFGRMVIYTSPKNNLQEKAVENLAKHYKKMYPEYCWDFS